MNVEVVDRLTGFGPVVEAHVVPGGLESLVQDELHVVHKLHEIPLLNQLGIPPRLDQTEWNDQRMTLRDREGVEEREG